MYFTNVLYKYSWHTLNSQKVVAIIINHKLNAVSEIQGQVSAGPSAAHTPPG